MNDDDTGWPGDDEIFVDFGERVRRGYDPEAVDRHLERLAERFKAQRSRVATSERVDDESLQVMMRAGRRSVEEALEESRKRADAMITEAESKADRVLSDAHARANQIRVASEEDVRNHEATTDVRRVEIEALDEEINLRQQALRDAAAELLELARGMGDGVVADLRDPAPRRDDRSDEAEAVIDLTS